MSRRAHQFGVSGGAILLLFCAQAPAAHAAPAVPAFAAIPATASRATEAAYAAAASYPTDPSLCPTTPDANEQNLGALTTLEPLTFPAGMTTTQNLYSRLIISVQICTAQTLSASDRSAFEKVLNTLGITKSKTYSSKVNVAFSGGTVSKFPTVIPFSYGFDESQNTYMVQTVPQLDLPWQPISDPYSLSFAYMANSTTSIGTAKLAASIIQDINGANPSTTLVSTATSNYLAIASNIMDQVASSALADKTSGSNTVQIDIVTQANRGLIFRLRDTNNKPLAAVKIAVVLTNTLANPVPFTNLTGDTAPKFTVYPDILGISVGGPVSGTLGDNISSEPSYKQIISANNSTDQVVFAQACNTLQSVLGSKYNLDIYDQSLAMGEVLYQSQVYFGNANLAGSQCFKSPVGANAALLGTMGLPFKKPGT